MIETAIVGVGMTPVGEHWDKSLRDLAAEAAKQALEDSNAQSVDAIYIGNAYGSTFNHQTHLGSLIADFVGSSGVEAYTTEAGDASGGVALRTANLAVASGAVETALVIGVEKSTDIVGGDRTEARTVSLDADFESIHGATLTGLAALLMRRYMHETNTQLADFEGFSINAHQNGAKNPIAMYQRALREGAFQKAPMLSDPVTLFDSAPDADGAAAVVITRADMLTEYATQQPVFIRGSSVATDAFMLQERADMLWFDSVSRSTQQALQQASVNLEEIDLLELHDSYTIVTALSLEAMGYFTRGQGYKAALDGEISLSGRLPISTFGGLKSRGNPAGANGIYQTVEAVLQLQNRAGDNQVAEAEIALVQNLGGLASTAATHILSI